MADIYMPRNEAELADLVHSAKAGGHALEVCGFRSKREAGRPLTPAAVVSTAKMFGITHFDPAERTISARAGTPLHEVESELARQNLELAFEPADFGRIYGPDSLAATLGAVAAMNISGPRRILRGSARDHIIGIRAVNGEGTVIQSGGHVAKNGAGVDLSKGLCGSWGTLAIMSELTFKVQPRAEESRTLALLGLPDEAAVGVMSEAVGTPYEVSGTIHLQSDLVKRLSDPDTAAAGAALTAIRLEGSRQSVAYRAERLRRELSPFGEIYDVGKRASSNFWRDIRACSFLSSDFDKPLWRITVAPSKAARIVRALAAFFPVSAAYEWAGGLVWLETPPSSEASVTELRRVLAEFEADSMLMRGPRPVRSSIEVFHPLPLAKMKLVQAIKKAFDPACVLSPGRMYAGV